MASKLAIVFCVHHKPWLMMSTLLTVLLQDTQEADWFFLYQHGTGDCPEKSSYQEYHRLARLHGFNRQLSPFDDRVRQVCQLRRNRIFEMNLENDHALDSGAWYKFIQSQKWRPYDFVFFLGEGILLNRTNTISSVVSFAQRQKAHWIASGHEKRRLRREQFFQMNGRKSDATEMDHFHDAMIQRVADSFCRDPVFKKVMEQWGPDTIPETQDHVPDIWERNPFLYWLRTASNSATVESCPWVRRAFLKGCRSAFLKSDFWKSRLHLAAAMGQCETFPNRREPFIHVNTRLQPLHRIVPNVFEEKGVRFHRAEEPEWFGCAVTQMMSREFLERLHERLERYQMYEVLDIPFSGTALEVIGGFLPIWLGVEKWFTDGFHRVRKNFVTFRREDDPEGICSYLNRYYRGSLCVSPEGDFIKIRGLHPSLSHLKTILNKNYFS